MLFPTSAAALLGGGGASLLAAARTTTLACGSWAAQAAGLLSAGGSHVLNPQRGLSTVSAPDPVALPLDFAEDKTVLVRLPERTWGPPARLSAAQVAAAALPEDGDGKRKKKGAAASSSKIAVLRDPFASFDQVYRPLSQVVRPLGSSALAVHSDVNQPHLRVVVDEYVRDEEDGGYRLHSVATDLLTYLRSKQVPVALLPDLAAISPSATAVRAASSGVRQSSNEVLMVAPTAFGFNEQAAQDNSFMHAAAKPGEGSSLTRQVLKEFAGLHHQLTEVAGVQVTLYEHSLPHGTPDACFPNNWFSTHPADEANGGVGESTLVLYPMKHPNRQAERRDDITRVLAARGYERVVDMSVHEQSTKTYFEGTGVLVLDRVNGVAYVDVSERADHQLAEEWVQRLGYGKLVAFRSTDLRGKSVYHTNVMMAIGTGVAIVCAESVADAKERQHLLSSLSKTHEVVQISLQQMDALCGNALELQSGKGLPVMAMSTQAYNAFTPDQRKAIERHVASIVHAPIDTLERVGGGGVRCTLAELF